MIYLTREQWLVAGIELLKPIFKEHKYSVPDKVRVSCGFPSKNALGLKKRRIGECWSDKASAGSHFEIFISPVLKTPYEALDTLLHELIHATVGIDQGHKGEFKKCALAIGMAGKMTCCGAGEQLKPRLEGILKKLGKYPHDKLDGMTNGIKGKPAKGAIKAKCEACGYSITIGAKWARMGMPICICGEEFVCNTVFVDVTPRPVKF